MKPKKFDAVKFMRKRRDDLSRKYMKDPDNQERDLIQIRKKYKMSQTKVSVKRRKTTPSSN